MAGISRMTYHSAHKPQGDGLTGAQRQRLKRYGSIGGPPPKPPKEPRPPREEKPREEKPYPPGWRATWVRKRDLDNPPPITDEQVQSYVVHKERDLELRARANEVLRAKGIAGTKAIPRSGAPWLENKTEKPVRQALFERLCEYDDILVPLGHRQLQHGWRTLLHRWLIDTECLTLTVRKGRRIGASTVVAPRLIAAWIEIVVPMIQLPPGEIIVVGLVSIKRQEATNRIAQISAVLNAVGIPFAASKDTIQLIGAPVEIRVMTRSWKTAVGENIGLLWCDEVARWESDDSSGNPAAEVIGSLKPALATLQVLGYAFLCLISSPWSEVDYHAEQFNRGDTEDQCVAFLPSWEGRDDWSEALTHKLEPDERIWKREYAAIPGSVLSVALDPDDAAAAFGMVLPFEVERRWCVIDASSLRGDAFAWMIGHESRTGLVIDQIGGWQDDELRTVTLAEVVGEIARVCRVAGVTQIYGDQREEAGLASLFQREHMQFTAFAWTLPSKHEAFLALRRLLRDRRIQLPTHAQLLKQMRTCKARLLPSGVTTYETNGLDYLSCLITLLHFYAEHFPQFLSRMMGGGILDAPEPEAVKRERIDRKRHDRERAEAEKRARRFRRRWG